MELILATESQRYEKTLDDRRYFWLMLYKQDEDSDVQYASYLSLKDYIGWSSKISVWTDDIELNAQALDEYMDNSFPGKTVKGCLHRESENKSCGNILFSYTISHKADNNHDVILKIHPHDQETSFYMNDSDLSEFRSLFAIKPGV